MRTIYRSQPPWPHRVLILGGGFAGVLTAQALERRLGRRTDVEIWLCSRDNFMLFTPLLPEVCSGVLEPRHVVNSLRGMLKRPSSWCITGDAREIDLDGKVVSVLGGDGDLHRLHYDTLVLALGGVTHTFGIPGIEEHSVGMKTLADAFSLRNRMIEILERADLEENADEKRAQLTFVVGGGGFSGVETAGEVEDFLRRVRKRYFPKIRQEEISAHLVELRDRILPEMPDEMGAYARRQLERRGFEVLTGMPIKELRENEVVIGEGDKQRTIPTRTVIWTGGVRPAPLVAECGIEVDKAGRAVVQPTMATSRDGVFAIGDCALIPNVDDPDGLPHAPTAQNAVREAKALARNIVAHIDGGQLEPFRYRQLGQLASIGHHTGVGVVFGIRVRGLIAWFMWRGYYWSRTPGFNRKVRVAIDWALTALFGTDPVQLKVEDEHSAMGSSGRRRPPLHDDA
ncbi:MAG TPA: NAD(P)/FAD-dependent oxidoreductase [Candidatus Limnocylindria bacterium]|nr:NAD(P)/FAD-dependent oxidoreductase [Candidatus Limnocylindria bacterium]